MSQVKRLVESYVGAAKAESDPFRRAQILRNGAAALAQLASDPKNRAAQKQLSNIGLSMASAAMQAQKQSATIEDFTQLLKDHHAAWQELGPEAAMSHVAMDATAIQRTNDQAAIPHMSVQPVSFDHRDTTLGRSAPITSNPTPDQIKQGIKSQEVVAFWQGQKDQSTAMTIDIGNVSTPMSSIVPVDLDARPFAKVQYGSDGNTQNTVELDIAQGSRITVVANYISVIVGMDPPNAIFDGGANQSPVLNLGASVGSFAAPSLAPVTRTLYIDSLPGNHVSPRLTLPPRAVLLLPPLASDFFASGATMQVNFYGYGSQFISAWQYLFTTIATFPNIPVPANAYFVNVACSQDLNGGSILLPFQLSL